MSDRDWSDKVLDSTTGWGFLGVILAVASTVLVVAIIAQIVRVAS